MTSKEQYAQLCEQEPSICIYDRPWWMDAVCGPENWDVLLYEKKGRLAGALPYCVKRRFGLRYISIPRATQHNGAWIRYPEPCRHQARLELEKEVMTALIGQLEETARKQGLIYYLQTFSPAVTNWQPFYWMGYSQTTRYTYRIAPGQDYQAVRAGYSHSVRNHIKNAEPLAVIRETGDIEPLYRMHCLTMGRQGLKSGYSLEFLRRLDGALAPRGARKILLAEDAEGTLCSAVYFVFDDGWVYQLMSGTDPQHRKNHFKTLLTDRGIRFACETGRGFDFEGSMLQGVEQFNRSFGAVQTPYFRIHKTYTKNPLLRSAINRKLG